MMLIKNQYPRGFSDSDLVSLKRSDGSYFDALEVHTNEAVYLVRVNHDLLEMIDDFDERNYDNEDDFISESEFSKEDELDDVEQ